jgi:hypothetical protein
MNRNSKKPAKTDVTTRPKREMQEVLAKTAPEPKPDDRELKSKAAVKAARDFARSVAGEDKVRFIHAFQIALDVVQSALRAKPDESNIFDKVKGYDLELLSEQFYSDPTFVNNALRLIEDDNGIIGGTETKGQFPECVAVGSPSKGWDSTGTLIAPNAVLTSKHSLGGVGLRILVGEDVNDIAHAEIHNVLKVVPYPPSSNPKLFENDLAILILKDTVKGVVPAQRAVDAMIKAAQSLIVVGFGVTNPNSMEGAGKKRMVEVPIRSYACEGIDRRFGCFEGLEMVAIGVDRDSCDGDSGGPAYVESQGKHYLASVTSRGVGRRCGDGGIYVRVDKYAKWIDQDVLPLYPPK